MPTLPGHVCSLSLFNQLRRYVIDSVWCTKLCQFSENQCKRYWSFRAKCIFQSSHRCFQNYLFINALMGDRFFIWKWTLVVDGLSHRYRNKNEIQHRSVIHQHFEAFRMQWTDPRTIIIDQVLYGLAAQCRTGTNSWALCPILAWLWYLREAQQRKN